MAAFGSDSDDDEAWKPGLRPNEEEQVPHSCSQAVPASTCKTLSP